MGKRPKCNPGDVAAYDARLVMVARRRLTGVANTEDAADAERRFDRWLMDAEKSPERRDSAFAAAQALRDMEVIEPCEAVYVFGQLFDVWRERFCADDAVTQAVLDQFSARIAADAATPGHPPTPIDETTDELRRRDEEMQAEFLAARGEHAAAALLIESRDDYGMMSAEGTIMLVDGKVSPEEGIMFESDPRTVALSSERLIALAATEHTREVFAVWMNYADSRSVLDPASAVASIQLVRELGVITFDESLMLIDEVVGSLARSRMEADRDCMRWERRMAEIELEHGLPEGAAFPENAEPIEHAIVRRLVERRGDRIQATYLRRFGEHRMANLLIENPAEYNRISQVASPGAWGVAKNKLPERAGE